MAPNLKIFHKGEKSMNRQELIDAIAERSGASKKATDEVLRAFVGVVMDEVAAGNKVQMIGFGNFEPVVRAAREGIDPHTKTKRHYDETRSAKFKPSKVFKEKCGNRA